jgi:hypothetical protein
MRNCKCEINDKVVEYFIDKNECWNVVNCATNSIGYAYMRFGKKIIGVHKAMFMFNILEIKEIPKGYYVLHSCDNRKCINPEHLRIGTQKDNMTDRRKNGRFGINISTENLENIKRLSSFVSQKKLGCLYGIHQTRISYILKNDLR